MNSNKKMPDLNSRDLGGTPSPTIKRIRQQPRHKIRYLLRSFIPLKPPESGAQTKPKNQP